MVSRGPKVFRPKGSRVWHFRFRMDGKRTQRSTREIHQATAQQVADDAWEAARKRARGEEPEPTLGRAVELWVQAHVLRRSSSHCDNVERWGKLHLGDLADLKLSKCTTRQVEDAQAAFLATHAKSTANLWRTYLRLIFRWAIRRRMIREIPWEVGALDVQKQPKRRLPANKTTDWLAEVDALTEREPSIALVIRLMAGMGLRCSEARAARWEWLDFERGEYTPGGCTKGHEAQERPVPDWLLSDLRGIAKPMGPMVPTREGRLVTSGRVQRVMDVACEALDIPRLTPHKLRHTYATWLSEAGVPVQDIQVVLGHKDYETTMGYLGSDLSRVRKGQARIAIRIGMGGRESGAVVSADAGRL